MIVGCRLSSTDSNPIVSPDRGAPAAQVQGRSHASVLPFVQPAPTGHVRTAIHLLEQILPRQLRPEYEQDADHRCPVRHKRTPSLGPRPDRGQLGPDVGPKVVRKQRFGHRAQIGNNRPNPSFVRRFKPSAARLTSSRSGDHTMSARQTQDQGLAQSRGRTARALLAIVAALLVTFDIGCLSAVCFLIVGQTLGYLALLGWTHAIVVVGVANAVLHQRHD